MAKTGKSSLIIYDSWGILFKNLPDEMAGQLIKMIVEYTFDGQTKTKPDESINAVFQMIRDKLDEDFEAYFEVKEKRTEAIKKRWAKTRSDNDTNDNKSIETNTNEYKSILNDSVSVSVSDSVSLSKDKDKGNKERSAFRPPDVSEVRSYCQERKNRVDPERFVDFYTSKGWLVGKNKMRDWRAAVRNWEKEENARSGTTKKSTQPSNTRNDYDFEAIERALVKNG